MNIQPQTEKNCRNSLSISDVSDSPYVPEPLEDNQEHSHLLSDFVTGADLIIENKTSEPRDFLMTERTTLSWVKFCSMLMLCAVALTLNYRLDTKGDDSSSNGDSPGADTNPVSREYNVKFGMSIAMVVMSIGCVILSTLNYFKAIYGYQREKIKTYSTELTTISLSLLIIALLVINILLIYFDK